MIKNIALLITLLALMAVSSYAQKGEPPKVYLSNLVDRIMIIDPITLTDLGDIMIPPGNRPFSVEIRSDHHVAFVSHNTGFSGVTGLSVIDLEARQDIAELFPLDAINSIKIGPDGFLYALFNSKQVMVINTQTFKFERKFPIPVTPYTTTFSPDGQIAYIISQEEQLIAIDTKTGSVLSSLNIPDTGGLGGTSPQQLAITQDGKLLYVGRAVYFNSTNQFGVAIVDTTSFSIIGYLPTERFSDMLLLSPDGKTLYLASGTGGPSFTQLLNAFDISSNKLLWKVTFSGGNEIQTSPNGAVIYDPAAREALDIYDAHTGALIGNFPVNVVLGGVAAIGDFDQGMPPSVQPISPQAGQTIKRATPFTIQWQTTSNGFVVGTQKLELSTDAGQTFKTILNADNLPGAAQSFNWNVSSQTVDKAQIRITAEDVGGHITAALSGIFSIGNMASGGGDMTPPTVKFLAPLGGEHFTAGDNLAINWSASDNVGVTSQDLSLSTDSGKTFPIALANGLAGNVQSFAYPIPANLQTNNGRLRLIVRDAAGNNAQAITAADFSIQAPPDTQAPTVTIAMPDGNSLPAGQPITVNWQSVDNVGVTTQSLLLSLDGGASFQTIASFDGNASSFTLGNIPDLDKTTAKAAVKITAMDAAGNMGEANANFTIAPAIANATFAKPILTITGDGFTAANAQASITIFINEKAVAAARIMMAGNNSITLKGNKKKLGLIKGSNSVKIVVDGLTSNSASFTF